MNKDETPQISYTFYTNEVTEYRDLSLRLALRTLLYKSFSDLDLDTVLTILRSEADGLHQKLTRPIQPTTDKIKEDV